MLRAINPFIYQRILDKGMPNPDIPSYMHESYSQCYEDTILDGLLRAYLIRHKVDVSEIAYLDIGANHPIATSNTYLLHIFHGIRGILVEANPALIPALKKFRPHDEVIHAAVSTSNQEYATLYLGRYNELSSLDKEFMRSWGAEGDPETKITVPSVRVMSLFEKLGGKRIILSIDVEGVDRLILEDIDYSVVKPFAIVVEHNDHLTTSINKGIVELLASSGYFLYAKTNVNYIFSLN